MQINLKQAILDFNANSGELSPGALMKQAECLLTNPDLTRTLKGMDPGNQKSFLDNVDKAYPTLDDFERVITLGDLCSVVAQLPTSAKLSGVRETPLNLSFKCGRSTVVIPGELDGKGVAIKSFHTPLNAIEKENFQNMLLKQAPVWKRLHHQNILPFRGVVEERFANPSLVYDWGQQGNITNYLSSNLHASRSSLLLGVAEGLKYLHGLNIPHGRLKETNIVVDGDGKARLTDYGMEAIYSDIDTGSNLYSTSDLDAESNFYSTSDLGTESNGYTISDLDIESDQLGGADTSRWRAPEILNGTGQSTDKLVTESKQADVFAFGMVAVEVFTGRAPSYLKGDTLDRGLVLKKNRPEKPENAAEVGLTDGIWELLQRCLKEEPNERPTMEDIVKEWKVLDDRPSLPADGAVEFLESSN